MSVATVKVRERAERRSLLERVLAAVPLLAIVAWLALLYATQAIGHPSPTLFTDELQWAQLSRGVAEDGLASIRGERTWFESLYVYVIAPAWWLGDTATSYEAIKYLNVLLMTAAAFPAYLLARRLVSKPAALAVAAASVSIPAMAYSLYVLTEALAYPWAVLSAWLIVEALARRTRWWIAGAAAAALAAPLVRAQLILIPASFAVAAFALWWRSGQARRLRGSAWMRGDTVALILLAAGAAAVFVRVGLHGNTIWRLATDPAPTQVAYHALWAVGALAIGLGVLPLVAGLTALFPRPGEPLSRHDSAFIALTASCVVLFPLYTGVKGAYNMLTFADRIDERNVIYLAPLLLLGTAIALERRRLRLVPLAGATVLAAYLLLETPIQLTYPYFDAPGFSIATMANRELIWPTETIERALVVTLAVSVAIALVARYAPQRVVRPGLALVAAAVVAWSLIGQWWAAGGANASAETYAANLPKPLDWVDQATGGEQVTFLGQAITTGVGLRTNLLEFWNSSIARVATTDGTELFPGPTLRPYVAEADGTLSEQPGTPYVLADSGILPVGAQVAERGSLRLFRVGEAIRLRESVEGVDEEAWMSERSSYNRFESAGSGDLVVTLSRVAFCPPPEQAPPAPRVSVTVGQLAIVDRNGQPGAGQTGQWASGSERVPNCERRELRLPVGPAPWRAEVHVDRTFKPADYGLPDSRVLGVMIAFRFEPEGA